MDAAKRGDARETMKIFALGALLLASGAARADNPIVWQSYNADPSARVFNGRLTIYPSHDRNDAQQFDMNDYHVYSSDDLKNWTDGGVILSAGQIPWVKPDGLPYALWAPDCVEKNGTYYFYFPAPALSGGPRIGVATVPSPSGPFVAQPNYIEGPAGIDPGVFVDDDGQAYIYWAGAGCQAAKLSPDMLSLAGPIVKIEGANNFFEGLSVVKRDGNYYLTYPAFRAGSSGKGGSGQNYDYAIGKNPLGPFEYQGSFSTSERGGNIHGSLVEFQGKWYCAYHDFSTSVGVTKSGFKRALRLDEIHFNADGTIQPLIWTTSGPPKLKNLDPFARVEAETLAQTDVPSGAHAINMKRAAKAAPTSAVWATAIGCATPTPILARAQVRARVRYRCAWLLRSPVAKSNCTWTSSVAQSSGRARCPIPAAGKTGVPSTVRLRSPRAFAIYIWSWFPTRRATV